MGDKTGIAWCDATWNPIFGCSKVSPGCANCYAETFALTRMKGKREYTGLPWTPENAGANVQLRPERLDQPIRWRRPRRIFVNSMSDLFHPEVPDDFIDRVFAVMALAPQHVFQILTKRPERMRAYLRDKGKWPSGPLLGMRVWDAQVAMGRRPNLPDWPLPNVWLGTSVENARWRTRIDELRQTPAAVRFLSCEPLLGSLTDWTKAEVASRDLGRIFFDLTGIDWVIVGGESGPGARWMDEQWVRDIVAAAREQGAAPFVKQMGDTWSRYHLGHPGHAAKPEEWPEDLRVQEWPR